MQDNENFENGYDDYEDSYHESKFNNPTLYFLDGDYKITLISEIDINAEDVYCTFHVMNLKLRNHYLMYLHYLSKRFF